MASVQRRIVHKQFNSPIALYSDTNIKATLNRELKSLGNGAVGWVLFINVHLFHYRHLSKNKMRVLFTPYHYHHRWRREFTFYWVCVNCCLHTLFTATQDYTHTDTHFLSQHFSSSLTRMIYLCKLFIEHWLKNSMRRFSFMKKVCSKSIFWMCWNWNDV